MFGLLLDVSLLSLAAAISPVVLMVGLTLMRGPRPVFQSGFFALGVAVTTVLLFGLGMLAIRAQHDGLEPGPLGSNVAHGVIGALLILGGIGLLFVRPSPSRRREFEDRYLSGNRAAHDYLIAGIIVMITNASSFVVVIAIIHTIARAAPGRPLEALAAFIVAAFVTALPGTAPFTGAALGGAALQRHLAAAGRLAVAYGRFVMAALWIAFGVKDLVDVMIG